MTFFRTAVETASCEVRKLLRTGRVPTTFTSVVPVVDGVTAYSVFAGLNVWDELFTDPPPPFLSPVPNRLYVVSVDVNPYNLFILLCLCERLVHFHV